MASVLIIEADLGFRIYAQVIYRDAGHRVTCVGDGDQALTMLATNRFDLAVVGAIGSPGREGDRTGIELIKACAELSVAGRTRLVLHSDDPLAALELDGRNIDVELLPRPAHPAELLALTNLGSGLELV
ncbi:MAG: hypothetical protein ACR2QE_01150 [Acidimicrobiales bacterium]